MEKRLKKYLEDGKFSNVPEIRTKTMASIKAKGNRTTELQLRMAFVRSGVRGFKLHVKKILGKPDFYFEQERLAVFVDGCFWHGCQKCGHIPKTRTEFWFAKISRNILRDEEINNILKKEGIEVIRIWEHEIKQKAGLNAVLLQIKGELYNEVQSGAS